MARAHTGRVTGFEIASTLFAVGALIGVLVLALAPLVFFHVLGAIILASGVAGAALSLVGLRLEHPDRWEALKASLAARDRAARHEA
jgi:hypothetical protein